MTQKKIPLIGGHVSAEGGLFNAVTRATDIGATTMQIFGASPRQWAVRMPKDEDVEKFKQVLEKSAIQSVFLHAAYVVNLGSSDDEVIEKSIKNLSAHLEIANRIGAKGLIFHVGSGKDGITKIKAIERAIEAMKRILEATPGKAWLIVENAAGGGQKLGANFEEISTMIKGTDSPRVKACYDTAHGFEAGLIEHYTPEAVGRFFDDWDSVVGLDKLVALHVNDSKTPFNSHHDRHENIGEGHIGLSGFEALAQEVRLSDKAWLLEVPGFDDKGPDQKNVNILRACFK